MKRIYLVTDGDYSDYSVLAVFSTEEKAEEFLKATGDTDLGTSARVEEMPLDSDEAKHWKRQVRMTRDGEALYVGSMFVSEQSESTGAELEYQQVEYGQVAVNAKGKEGAVKAANEIRAQLIAFCSVARLRG